MAERENNRAAPQDASGSERVIIRPSIPAVAWVAVAAMLGVLVAERFAWASLAASSRGHVVWAQGLALALTLVATVRVWFDAPSRRALLTAGALAFLVGLSLGLGWVGAWDASCSRVAGQSASRWTVEVLSDASEGTFGASSTVRVSTTNESASIPRGSAVRGVLLQAFWPSDTDPPDAGRVLRLSGTASAARPGREGRERLRLRKGICGSLRVARVERAEWARSLRGFLGPPREWARQQTETVKGDAGALLDGIVLGDRRRLAGTEAERSFKVTGLTHLVAVSGGHLVVVVVAATVLGRLLRLRRGQLAVAVVGLTGAYVIFSGVQVSAVRAWAMALIVLAVGLSGRRGDPVAALSLTALAMVAVNPGVVFDIGFQLSALSVLGLLLLARLAGHWLAAALPPPLEAVAAGVAMTVVAQVATLPVTTRVFSQLSLVSPVANLVVGPLVSVALLVALGGLVLAGVIPAVGAFVLAAAGAVLALAAHVAGFLAGLPNAAVPATPRAITFVSLLAFGAVATWVRWPTPSSRRQARLVLALSGCVFLGVTVGPPPAGGQYLTVMDVGQGDAILLRDGPSAVLVDTGPNGAGIKEGVARSGVKRFDAVIITHEHADHDGGLEGLREVARIGRVYHSGGSQAREDVRGSAEGGAPGEPAGATLQAGDELTLGRWRLKVLWPRGPDEGKGSANDTSIVMLARCGSLDVLLTGDAEREVLEKLLAQGSLPDVDVLKVGHHGSKVAVDERVLSALRPEYAVISVGAGNRFGHPAGETVRLLERSSAGVVRTDREGDVTFRVDGPAFEIRTTGRTLSKR